MELLLRVTNPVVSWVGAWRLTADMAKPALSNIIPLCHDPGMLGPWTQVTLRHFIKKAL